MTPSPALPKDALPKKVGETFSMTGYAQARSEQNGWAVRISIKSVNHRFLDLKLRLPEGFDLYELRLRQVIRERIHRGHVEIYVNVDPAAGAPVQVNRELAQTYMRVAEEFRQQSKAAADVDVVAILRLPGVIAGLSAAVPEAEHDQERHLRLIGLGADVCGHRRRSQWRWAEEAD